MGAELVCKLYCFTEVKYSILQGGGDSPKETLRERKYHWILGCRLDDHPGLFDLNLSELDGTCT
ncbi:MAG: hypothetical protein V7K77_17205 [Nostoc sp.]|uniref:hypothetical protein n=1 Tax=Nostoc sp. TaxID=1180 RepID=UPI002FFB0422